MLLAQAEPLDDVASKAGRNKVIEKETDKVEIDELEKGRAVVESVE